MDPTAPPIQYSVQYDNGVAKVTVPETGTYTVIFAAYSNGALKGIKIKTAIFDVACERTVAPDSFNADGKKVMLWDNKDMKMLCEAA